MSVVDLPMLVTAHTGDGRVYVSVRYVPDIIGNSLRVLTPLADIVGWVYGTVTGKMRRGVSVIGTQFTRNATLLFHTGSCEQSIRLV